MATETPTPPLTTYSGSCSCGAFGYTVALPAITSVFECNCSICARRGFKWIFPGTNPFTVTKDDGTLTEYQFGAKNMTHKFCAVCGTEIYGISHKAPEGQNMGLNVRTLNDIDILSVPVGTTFDAIKLPPLYSAPSQSQSAKHPLPHPHPTSAADAKYTGSCHCQAIIMTLAPRTPLDASGPEIKECTCPTCIKSAPLSLCLHSADEISVSSEAAKITTYTPPGRAETHSFCAVCGTTVWVQEAANAVPSVERRPNLRCFPEDVDLKTLKIEHVSA